MEERHDGRADMKALFKGQSERAYIFGKLEKLAHAVIILTSQADTERSLVERLEVCVLDSVREASGLSTQSDHVSLVSILLELVSLLRLSGTAGIVTASNVTILVDEYSGLLSRLALPSVQGIVLRREELLIDEEGGGEGSPSWGEIPGSIDDLFSLPQGSTGSSKGHEYKRHSAKRTSPGNKTTQPLERSRAQSKGHSATSRAQQATTERSQAIITVVKARGVVSIRDVASVITDCSEKTLQRELLALVERGVLKKEGERRWSTYRLA